MRGKCALGLLTIVGLAGCQGTPEETPAAPSGRGLSVQVPYIVAPASGFAVGTPAPAPSPSTTPTPAPTPTPEPAPSPTPTPPPAPTPEPTPTPAPTPEPTPGPNPSPTPQAGCSGLGMTIDARCGGATPDCGIPTSSKAPTVNRGSKVTLDAAYFKDSERNKVHAEDECYPGAIERWTIPTGVNCGDPFSNNHVLTCGRYNQSGSYTFEACGGGLCSSITVKVR